VASPTDSKRVQSLHLPIRPLPMPPPTTQRQTCSPINRCLPHHPCRVCPHPPLPPKMPRMLCGSELNQRDLIQHQHQRGHQLLRPFHGGLALTPAAMRRVPPMTGKNEKDLRALPVHPSYLHRFPRPGSAAASPMPTPTPPRTFPPPLPPSRCPIQMILLLMMMWWRRQRRRNPDPPAVAV